MPIFEFHCARCDHSFEKLVRSETTVVCPACSSAKVERLISAPARPAGARGPADYSSLGPPKASGGGCGGGGCGCH